MNHRLTPAFLFALLAGAVIGQPTLNQGSHVPTAGQDFAVVSADGYIGVGPAGADVAMDYWNMLIPNTGNRTWRYRAASSSSTSAQIPTATLLYTDGGSDTTFWNSTADGFYHVGSRTDAEGVVNFTDPLQELKFPCTYGTTWTDAMSATYVVGGFVTVTRTGTIEGNADAYGTLRLPEAAVVPNVLSVKVRRQINDNSAVLNVVRIANINYFYSSTSPFPMLRLTEDSVRLGTGAWTVVKGAQWVGNGFVVGLDEEALEQVAFTAYPNPASNVVTIGIDAAKAGEAQVIDATGRVVLRARLTADRSSFDVGALTAGAYSVKVFDPQGRSLGVQRLVVE